MPPDPDARCGTIDRASYPRPDRYRERWLDLTGPWAFSFDEPRFDRTITVPFAYQATASGIGDTSRHDVVWYRRRFEPPPRAPHEHLLLHFGAIDFAATVWVNDHEVGHHRGGHTSFTVDATPALRTANDTVTLTVMAVDEYRSDQVRGKQTATFPYLVHYTPTSGIWQPVWSEVTGTRWIDELRVVAEADGSLTVGAEVPGGQETDRLAVAVRRDGALVGRAVGSPPVSMVLDDVRVWSPTDPALYDLTIELIDREGTVIDAVESYAGFRTSTIDGDRWLLNGEPLRQRLLLDQGYWPGSLMTPPSEQAIRADIDFVKRAGFTGVRKHQKLEDPRWLFEADRRGLLVWAEMPSPFGLARIRDGLATDFRAEWAEAVRRDRNHPCIICWVPFNESWGIQGVRDQTEFQDLVRSVVASTRALDPTRAVLDNSGWCHVDTDVVDVHDYDQNPDRLRERWTDVAARGWVRSPADLGADVGTGFDLATYLRHVGVDDVSTADRAELRAQVPVSDVWATGCAPPPGSRLPFVLSEFGGVGLSDAEVDQRFDYAGAADGEDLLERFTALVDAAESVPDLCGWCWTQLADVEQEINGLLTADRRPKIDAARLRAALDRAPWAAR